MARARLFAKALLFIVAFAAVTASPAISLCDASGLSRRTSTGGSGSSSDFSSNRENSHAQFQALLTKADGVLSAEPETAREVFGWAAKILKRVEQAKGRAAAAVATAKQKADAAKGTAEWEMAELTHSLVQKTRSQTAISSLALLASSHVSAATQAVVLAGMAEQEVDVGGKRLRGNHNSIGHLSDLAGPRVSEGVLAARLQLDETHAFATEAAALAASITGV